MKYWDMLRVGAKTSAPTPVVDTTEEKLEAANEKIDELSNKVDELLKEIMNNKPKEMPAALTDSVLDDDEIADVTQTIADYWKRYFHDIELKTTLNPYFVWNIPKTAYQLSRSLRAKGAPYILDPLYWFCMFIIKNKDDIPQFIGMSIYETDETMCAAIEDYMWPAPEDDGDDSKDAEENEADDSDTPPEDYHPYEPVRDDDEIADGEVVDSVEDLGTEQDQVDAVTETVVETKELSDELGEDEHVQKMDTDDDESDEEEGHPSAEFLDAMLVQGMEGKEPTINV